jgi:hypothetical protein
MGGGRPDRETMGEERESATGSRPPFHAPTRGAAPHPGCDGGWRRSRKGWVGAWGGGEIGRAGVATGSGVSQREVRGSRRDWKRRRGGGWSGGRGERLGFEVFI